MAQAAAAEQTAEDNVSRPARFAKDQLKAFIERVERLEEDKKGIADDIKDVYAEAKGNGFDVKVLRHIVRLRKLDGERAQRNSRPSPRPTWRPSECWSAKCRSLAPCAPSTIRTARGHSIGRVRAATRTNRTQLCARSFRKKPSQLPSVRVSRVTSTGGGSPLTSLPTQDAIYGSEFHAGVD